MAAETMDRELSTGGGGGIDRPIRPVENEDEEGPERRARAVLAIRQLHAQRYGSSESSYIGMSPEEAAKLSEHKRSDTLPLDTGSIALEGYNILLRPQSFN